MQLVEIDRLNFSYRGSPNRALANVCLKINSGECWALLGPNGAGKSTLMNCILGLDKPKSGSILFPEIISARRSNGSIGYVAQTIALLEEFSGLENLDFYSDLLGIETHLRLSLISNLARQVGIDQILSKRVVSYSGGMKRRLHLAIGLLANPQLLILDESLVGVDIATRRSLLKIISDYRDQGCGILMASHQMDEIETICSHAAILDKGILIWEGRIEELVDKSRKQIEVEFFSVASAEMFEGIGSIFMLPLDAAIQNSRICFQVANDESTLSLLYRWAEESGSAIKSLTIRSYNFSNRYFDITGQRLQDDV